MTISPEPSSKGDITHRINFAQPIWSLVNTVRTNLNVNEKFKVEIMTKSIVLKNITYYNLKSRHILNRKFNTLFHPVQYLKIDGEKNQ